MIQDFDAARELARRAGFCLRRVDTGRARAIVDGSTRIMEVGPYATARDLLEATDPYADLPPGWRD